MANLVKIGVGTSQKVQPRSHAGAWEREKLSVKLGKPYQKNSTTMHEDWQLTGGDQLRAITRAERLLKKYGERTDYADHNPSTTVHLLVEALNKFLEEFRQKTNKFQ